MNMALLRFVCILQFALTGYMAVSSFVYVFDSPGWHSIISFIAFCLAVYQTTFVLQILYKNFPDTPLSLSQKSTFNWLFMLNFFMLSALITYNINDVKTLINAGEYNQQAVITALFYSMMVLHLAITVFQIIILLGMVKARRALNSNFEKRSTDLDILR